MTSPLEDPRVVVDMYTVYPTCVEDLPEHEKLTWALTVKDGHAWGWSVRREENSPFALNKKGQWILESRGSGSNRFRRFSLEEALSLALKYVDVLTINRSTAQEAVDRWRKS